MISHSIRASRPLLARVVRQQYTIAARRTFFTPTASRSVHVLADIVQDMYLQQLKTYKPAQIKPNDAEGHVQAFAVPKPPKSPEESDIAKDLKAYESQIVEVEGGASDSGAPLVEEDWFEEEEEDETPAAAH